MTRRGTQNMLKVLGILSLCFSVFCICFNLGTMFGSMMTSSFAPMMDQAQREVQDRQIARLERQRAESNDTAEQERLDRRIEELRNQPDPTDMTKLMMSPETMRFAVIGGVSGLVTNLVLAVGGIGLLLMAGWGRTVSLVAAVLKILNIVIMSLINLLVFMPKQYEAVQKMMESMPTRAGGPPPMFIMKFVEAWGTIWIIISIFLVSIYPVVLLILLNLKDVRRLLGGRWPEAEIPAGDDDLAPRRMREY